MIFQLYFIAKIPPKNERGWDIFSPLILIKLLVVWKKSTRFAKIDQDVIVKDSSSMLRRNKWIKAEIATSSSVPLL